MNNHVAYTDHKMSYCQILPPPPTIEDAMEDVALTPYNRPESAFNFEDGSKHQSVDYNNFYHVPPNKPLLYHLLTAAQRQ